MLRFFPVGLEESGGSTAADCEICFVQTDQYQFRLRNVDSVLLP